MLVNKFTKGRNGMYIVTLEDNTKLTIHEDLILKYNILITKTITDSQKENILEENKKYEIYEVALSYISKKIRSSKELRKYLLKKEYQVDLIDDAIELLYTQGYLNDKIYAKSLVHDRILLSMDGPNKIKKELSDNNIDNAIIEEAIAEYSNEIELEKIEKIVNKQIKLNTNKGSNLLKKKINMYLINLGYNLDLINNVLNSINISDNNLYKKEYDKLYKTLSQKYSGKELEYRLKQKLYQKGFKINDYE